MVAVWRWVAVGVAVGGRGVAVGGVVAVGAVVATAVGVGVDG